MIVSPGALGGDPDRERAGITKERGRQTYRPGKGEGSKHHISQPKKELGPRKGK